MAGAVRRTLQVLLQGMFIVESLCHIRPSQLCGSQSRRVQSAALRAAVAVQVARKVEDEREEGKESSGRRFTDPTRDGETEGKGKSPASRGAPADKYLAIN